MNTHEAGVYDTPDDLLAEFFDDPADREEVKREAECLAAEEHGAAEGAESKQVLNGTTKARVALLTGISAEDIDRLGGVDEDG
jgi:hypothetical protein